MLVHIVQKRQRLVIIVKTISECEAWGSVVVKALRY
jgi:hypothetical protein